MNDQLEIQNTTVAAPVDVEALDTAKPLVEVFQPYRSVLEKWEAKVQSLAVTDIKMTTEMAQARLARLELKIARVTMDKTRVGLVSKLKERTSKIDSVARAMREKFEELEAKLLESEEFASRHEAKLKAQLKASREAEMIPLVDTPLLGDLSDLSCEDYAHFRNNAKILRQAKIDAAAKAEAEAKAKAEADRVERERVAAENARLKAEAIEAARVADLERRRVEAEMAEERRKAALEMERAAQAARVEHARVAAERAEERKKALEEVARVAENARKEREAAEAVAYEKVMKAAQEAARLKSELDAREKAEMEQVVRAEAERKSAEAAKRAAAAAPDKAKMKAFAATVRGLQVPALSSVELKAKLAVQIEWLAKWAESEGQQL